MIFIVLYIWKIHTIDDTHILHAYNLRSVIKPTITNGGSKGGTRDAPRGVQILSVSCSFWENFAKWYVGDPRELAPPPVGNPGSASDYIVMNDVFILFISCHVSRQCCHVQFVFPINMDTWRPVNIWDLLHEDLILFQLMIIATITEAQWGHQVEEGTLRPRGYRVKEANLGHRALLYTANNGPHP